MLLTLIVCVGGSLPSTLYSVLQVILTSSPNSSQIMVYLPLGLGGPLLPPHNLTLYRYPSRNVFVYRSRVLVTLDKQLRI